MRINSCKMSVVLLITAMSIWGCQTNNKEEVKPVEVALEDEKPTDGFAYVEKGAGIVLTEYYGNSEEVQIPEEIDGYIVIVLDSTLFKNSTQIKRVRIPGTVESVASGIFEKCPDVIVECYTNNLQNIASAGKCSLNILGDNPECARYVQIYSSETKGVMECIYLKDGEAGKEGTYSEGASFAIEDGEAVLTLNNYDGGMIVPGNGNLTIRLVEGSFNSITAADKQNGIITKDNLTIEGNGILSMKAGDSGSGVGIQVAYGDLTIQDQVNMFVKSGFVDRATWGIHVEAGDIKITNSKVEVQIAETGVYGMAIVAGTDKYNVDTFGAKGEILLEQCEIVEGGMVAGWYTDYDGDGIDESLLGRTIGESKISIEDEHLAGVSEYVRIEPQSN